MEMTAFNDGSRLCVKLSGEIDHHEAKDIRERLDKLIFENRPKALIVNLSGIVFMDSSGLGLILGRYAKATEMGIPCILANPNPPIRRILDLAGTERLIKIETRGGESNRGEI